jgi:hypothetical protein
MMRYRMKVILHLAMAGLMFVFILEICARIDDSIKWRAPFLSFYSVDSLFGFDDEGMPINIPNSRFEKWSNNNLGFRGRNISRAKPPGRVRVIFLGTSETYGTCESPGQEWPAQLGRILAQVGPFEVINAAGPGFSFQYYRRFFEKYINPLKPDVVVILANPFFHASRYIRASRSTSSPRAQIQGSNQQSRTPRPSLISHLRIFSKIKQSLRQSLPSGLKRMYYTYIFKKQIAQKERLLLASARPLDAVPESCLSAYSDELKDLIDYLKGQGMQIILGSFPSLMNRDNIDKYPELFLGFRGFSIEFSLWGDIDIAMKYNEVTRSLAHQMNLIFVDAAEAVPKDLVHFCDNVHFKDTGARAMAQAFAKAISQLYSP